MMTHPLSIASKLPIKLWLLGNYQQMYMYVCVHVYVCVYVCVYMYD